MDVTKVGEVAGNAAVAAVEVSKAVRMRGVEAPDVQKSFVAKGGAEVDLDGPVAVDEEASLVYDKTAIQAFWDKQGGALQKRWAEFLGLSVPFLTRVATLSITGGAAELSRNDRSLARDARVIIEKLGPTYIKAGQMMSVRPDVLRRRRWTSSRCSRTRSLRDRRRDCHHREGTRRPPRTVLRRDLGEAGGGGVARTGVPRASRRHRHLRRGQGAEAGDPQHREQGPCMCCAGRRRCTRVSSSDSPRSRGPTTSRCSTSGPWASTPSSTFSTRRPTSRDCGTSCWTRRR